MYKQSELLKEIMKTFGKSFINASNKLILDEKVNVWFSLEDIESDFELKCKLIEYVSRAANKTEPYRVPKLNNNYQRRNLENINYILETKFTHDEMRRIYIRLGNGVNQSLTIKFINSGYDMETLNI